MGGGRSALANRGPGPYERLSQRGNLLFTVIAALTAVSGFALRMIVLLMSGNREVGPFSGVGDQIRYLTLADSISKGWGLTYARQPTALRPPIYPLLLAIFHAIFGSEYLFAVRIFQFLIGLAVAYFCFLIAKHLFGASAGAMAGAIALCLPTLIFISAELQTEQLATFLTIVFVYFLLRETQARKHAALGAGASSGLVSLLRFNGAVLIVIGALACLWPRRKFRDAFVLCGVAGLILCPWIIRNARVFHGRAFFSTHGGINLLEGVLTPDGRAQNGEDDLIRQKVGWLHTDIELNSPSRLSYPSEDRLDKQARVAALAAWSDLNWRSCIRLLSGKILRFWLSTDQLLDTKSFSGTQQKLRIAGVVAYWIVLGLSVVGWIWLFYSSRDLALTILGYILIVTAAHLPFVMNTRLRIPLFEPLLTVLAGGGFCVAFSQAFKTSSIQLQKDEVPLQSTGTVVG
jgi:4-amino-4-deoxy-L-arabinose transferase-like glycosyltransferase